MKTTDVSPVAAVGAFLAAITVLSIGALSGFLLARASSRHTILAIGFGIVLPFVAGHARTRFGPLPMLAAVVGSIGLVTVASLEGLSRWVTVGPEQRYVAIPLVGVIAACSPILSAALSAAPLWRSDTRGVISAHVAWATESFLAWLLGMTIVVSVGLVFSPLFSRVPHLWPFTLPLMAYVALLTLNELRLGLMRRQGDDDPGRLKRLADAGFPHKWTIRFSPRWSDNADRCQIWWRGVRDPALVISRGFLDRLSDSQLRTVIAHERRHVERRHVPKRIVAGLVITTATLWILQSGPFASLRTRVAVAAFCVCLVRPLADFWLSSLHERDADRIQAATQPPR